MKESPWQAGVVLGVQVERAGRFGQLSLVVPSSGTWVRVHSEVSFAVGQAVDELLQAGVTERDVRCSERWRDLDTGNLEIGAAEHDDFSEPYESALAERVDFVVGRGGEGGYSVASPFGM